MFEYKVLIIDDDVWMQRILSRIFESFGFKQTYVASDAFEGIAMAVEHKPMVIVLDILMPELSGLTALKILKKIKITKDIPVIIVSALSDTENLSLAVKYGTSGFISKPFTRSTVYEKLAIIFGRDKLEAIARGEYVDLTSEYQEEEPYTLDIFADTPVPPPPLSSSELPEIPEKKTPPKTIPQEQLINYYQDDERRSIEAIKKLLFKPKKP